MDTKRTQNASSWYYSTVFRDEPIQQRCPAPEEKLPSPLRAARSLETNMTPWQSRDSLFVKQGKLLASYEDDFGPEQPVLRYFPTYQSLSDRELRCYFSWRTRLRHGDVGKTSLSYAFLYIYELLNQIGVDDAMDGYWRLKEFARVYGALDDRILPYLRQWLTDYVVYYGLDPALLADTAQVRFDKAMIVFADIENREDAEIMEALTVLAPGWLKRSRFYADHRQDMETVISGVLRKMAVHYATRCTKPMHEQYFGPISTFSLRLFDSAVFLDRQKTRSCEFILDAVRVYRCSSGLWTLRRYACPERPSAKLEDLMKTIDCVMREMYEYKHPIRCELTTKWVLKLIRQEVQDLLDARKAAEAKKITIDHTRLAAIRMDADITRDRLMVDEELMEEEPSPVQPTEAAPMENETPLAAQEYRLIQCLLYGRELSWVRGEGHILSVLVDGINEKLYDLFSDSVLTPDDPPEVIEDYIDELKEMIHL